MHDKLNPIPNGVAYVDQFKDAHLDTSFWDNVVTGGASIVEGIGKVSFSTSALGTGKLSTIKKFGFQQTISIGITMVTGSDGAAGNHAEACLSLYKDSTHFIKFGPYRDTIEGKNTISRLSYQNGGASATVIDFSATITDAVLHQYTIAVLENKVIFILDGVAVYDLEIQIIDYLVNLELIATGADNIDVDFSNFICVKNTEFLASLFSSGSNAAIMTAISDSETNILGAIDDVSDKLDVMDGKIPFTGNVILNDTSEVSLEFLAATHGSQFEITFAAALGQGIMPKALQSDGGSLVDFTDECNTMATRDVQMLPNVPVNGDAFIVMSAAKFCYIDVYLDGGVVNTNNEIEIQYYNDSHVWTAIPGVVDGTYDIQSLGKSGRVSFSPPADWDIQTLDGYSGYAVRFVVTTPGASPDVPLATHIQLSDNTSASFDQVASVFDTLQVAIRRSFPTIGYQTMFGDEMSYVQALGDRDVDINGLKCGGNTRISFKLNTTPDKSITIPYFGFTRRL